MFVKALVVVCVSLNVGLLSRGYPDLRELYLNILFELLAFRTYTRSLVITSVLLGMMML